MGDMSLSFRLSLTSPCRPRTSLLPPFVRSSFTSFTRPLRSSVTHGSFHFRFTPYEMRR